MANYSPKICPICKREFVPAAPSSKYCSRECRAEAERAHDRERQRKEREKTSSPYSRRPKSSRILTDAATGKTPSDYARRQVADTVERFARIDLSEFDTKTAEILEELRNDNEALKAENEDLKDQLDQVAKDHEALERSLLELCSIIGEQSKLLALLTEG